MWGSIQSAYEGGKGAHASKSQQRLGLTRAPIPNCPSCFISSKTLDTMASSSLASSCLTTSSLLVSLCAPRLPAAGLAEVLRPSAIAATLPSRLQAEERPCARWLRAAQSDGGHTCATDQRKSDGRVSEAISKQMNGPTERRGLFGVILSLGTTGVGRRVASCPSCWRRPWSEAECSSRRP